MNRVCAHPSCTTIIATNQQRCAEHAAEHQRARNQRPVAQIYRDPRWRRTRQVVLTRDHHTCQLCGEHGTVADHHPTPALQCADPYDPDTCRTLCTRCSGKADGGRAGKGGASKNTPDSPNPALTHREKNRVELRPGPFGFLPPGRG